MSKSISILGCGWLGLPLAKYLIGKGWSVKGSTTSSDKLELLRENGIEPYCIDVRQTASLVSDFFASDYLLVNIPPTKVLRELDAYRPLVDAIRRYGPSKVIMISSTSVYPAINGLVAEERTEQLDDGENALLDIERLFQQSTFQTTVIRFGGLVGGVRYPGRFFTPDTPVKGGEQPVNLIHLVDCIRLIEAVIETDCFGEVFNGVADTHPTKKEFYTLAASLNGQLPPRFIDNGSRYKIVSNRKVKQVLGFRFTHPDLMEMISDNALWQRDS